MRREYKSPIFLGRVSTVMLGTVVLGFGLHSHLQSFWVQNDSDGVPNYISLCTSETTMMSTGTMPFSCPSISMERLYISTVVLFFVLSVVALIASCVVELKSYPFNLYDFGYHVMATILLMIAASVYMTSAEQVYYIYEQVKVTHPDFNIRRGEKILAGIFTIIQAFVYGFVAFMIAKGS